MKYTARFLKDVYEIKYAIIPYHRGFSYRKDGKWNLAKCHHGVGYPFGYKYNNVMQYERFIEGDMVFYEDKMSIILEVGNKVKLGLETVIIKDVVRNLDGSIDYHTDKEDEIYINTYDTYFDERKPKEKDKEIKVVEVEEIITKSTLSPSTNSLLERSKKLVKDLLDKNKK